MASDLQSRYLILLISAQSRCSCMLLLKDQGTFLLSEYCVTSILSMSWRWTSSRPAMLPSTIASLAFKTFRPQPQLASIRTKTNVWYRFRRCMEFHPSMLRRPSPSAQSPQFARVLTALCPFLHRNQHITSLLIARKACGFSFMATVQRLKWKRCLCLHCTSRFDLVRFCSFIAIEAADTPRPHNFIQP